ncbi:DUF711 family protein [Pseudoduganella lutea]|uniref:DUF711 family protein n=1 Tax=Pseudoduganella lutea TaxID=321985 RepID=A0A4P6KWM6_9BURK|nr:DUF711 family protein [Pseudoduganella lutea]QBE63367.1 DUF711 family protein [Pseudoduganella lutea]
MPTLRTITFGCPLDGAAPGETAATARRFFAHAARLLDEAGLAARCFRYVAPPVEQWLPGGDPATAGRVAVELEQALGESIWCCLPGPACDTHDSVGRRVDLIDAIVGETRHVFTNMRVAGEQGLHNEAVAAAAETMARLGTTVARQQDNFRFAALAWIKPATPYFPAAWHDGAPGFSVALELAGPFLAACGRHDNFADRLDACRQELTSRVAQTLPVLMRLAREQGVRFLGYDLSLAPFPGDETSAVAVVESMNGSRIGQLDFMFALYAVNDMLQHALPSLPMVGFNGTMLSVLEDTRLAEATAAGDVGVKDLLLLSTVCGCGLDMIPVSADSDPARLATLVRAISTIAQKWRKPLIARLLPATTNARGITRFEHDFIVNTAVLRLDTPSFMPTERVGVFEPLRRAA